MTTERKTPTKHHHHPLETMHEPPQPLPSSSTTTTTSTTISILLTVCLFSLLLLLSLSSSSSSSSPPLLNPRLFPPQHLLIQPDPSSPPPPPSIAYFISGSANDSGRILRLLLSIYHPKNQYLLHLDLSAAQTDRDFLARIVHSLPVFKAAQNVNVIGKSDFAYKKGSSPLSSLLHGASILLRVDPNWDWFINLNAADYPLVTQDGIIMLCRCVYFVSSSRY